ncbi:MAG: galactose oxidase-like domain-containing protein, partial [Bryobacteraceae bacterium]
PAQGSQIASLSTVSATASDDTYVAGVQFLLDGAPLGAQLTTQPYSITWDTTSVAAGSHTLAARATDSVGLMTLSTPVTFTVDNSGNPAVIGNWSSVVNLPAVAVNLILLRNNNVLFYQDGATPTLWNYISNTFTNIPAPADLFCSGHALLADGRILVVGGYGGGSPIGLADAEIFDPVGKNWTPVPNMVYKRWYPTATTLPDGRILVTAGWQTSAHTNAGISEIYDPAANSWTSLTNANNPFETYPFMYVLPDGRVIHIGGSEYPTDTDILDLNTQTWSVVDARFLDGASATMYTPDKFMKAGSSTDSQGSGPSSNTTFVLDMTQPSPAWQQTPSMVYPRSFLNLTTLPDGSVLATGGETDKNGGNIANAVYAAELWSPHSQTWSTMSSMHTPREYHGTALLLPDGRVLVSGMGADFGNVPDQKSAEFYSPPYLFKGSRPTVSQAPTQIQYGSNFFVGTPDGSNIASVALIRTGAVTHFFDQNERFLPLTFTQSTGGLTVTAPANANLAPPGYYMLFLVNSAGVPSIAPFVQVQ